LFGHRWLPQTTHAVGCSGDLLPPSPPGEKTTARQDQAGQASTDDGARHGSCGVYQDRSGEMSTGAVAHDMKNLGDIEWLPRHDATKREKIGAELTVNESISVGLATSNGPGVALEIACLEND
jgi:hypothetical protein